jgi:FixJ family two-component response regulator
MDGLSLQEKLLEKKCRLPVIFMTGHGNIPMSVQAMKKGAVDFLPKPFEAKDLRNAILKAVECDAHALEMEIQEGKVKSLVDTLTPREKEVLRWVITGKLNKQIASELGVAEKTVKIHRSRVMQKTKVSSVAELVRLAEKADIPPAA